MSSLIFNMAWIDLNFKGYNRDEISPGLTAQSSLKFLLYYTLRLNSRESHHLLLTWYTLLQYFIIKISNPNELRIWYLSLKLFVMGLNRLHVSISRHKWESFYFVRNKKNSWILGVITYSVLISTNFQNVYEHYQWLLKYTK